MTAKKKRRNKGIVDADIMYTFEVKREEVKAETSFLKQKMDSRVFVLT
jgi:hypothetical protein